MKTGEVKFVKDDENGYYYLFVKGDITTDPYYLENLKSTVLNDMKFEELTQQLRLKPQRLNSPPLHLQLTSSRLRKLNIPTNNSIFQERIPNETH